MSALHPLPAAGRRAVVLPDNSVDFEEFEVRRPGPGEVLIETVSTLISAGTELGSQEQRRAHDFKPGYSNTGVIAAVGEGVEGYEVFHEKELTLVGCHQPKCPTTATPAFPWTQQYNRRQILGMIGRGELDVECLTTHRMPYGEAQEAYRLLREERDKALGILLVWRDPG